MGRRRRDLRHCRQRARQAQYEARLRAGVMLCPVPLGPGEIGALVRLGWLPGDAVVDRRRAGKAIARLLAQLIR
jgi:hypothetical protein